MVSEKLIVILIIASILISVVSIVFTFSSTLSLDNQIISKVNQERIPDADRASVGIIINSQPGSESP